MGLTFTQEDINKMTFPRVATAELLFSMGWTAGYGAALDSHIYGHKREGCLPVVREKNTQLIEALSDPEPTARPEVLSALLVADEIIADMVAAEDGLIADLKASGDDEALLRMEFPIMKRMRAYLADRAASGMCNPGDLVVIDNDQWEPCSPAWLKAHPNDCGTAPRVYNAAEGNHYHPKVTAKVFDVPAT